MSAKIDFAENPIMSKTHSHLRQQLCRRFPELNKCSHSNYLFLGKYIQLVPWTFYSESAFRAYFAWLEDRHGRAEPDLVTYLVNHDAEINRAIMHLDEVNKSMNHDEPVPSDDPILMRLVDERLHPNYLRLVEGVFTPCIRMVAHFSRVDRNVGTDNIDVYQAMEEIEQNKILDLQLPYSHILRNGIAHGGIEYFVGETKYSDKAGKSEFATFREVLRLHDDILDTCNGFLLALAIFMLSRSSGNYLVPQRFWFDELRAQTNTSYWENVSALTSTTFNGAHQLNLYARAKTTNRSRIFASSFQSLMLISTFTAEFDRVFVQVNFQKNKLGFLAFNGAKAANLVTKKHVVPEDYEGILESDGLYSATRYHIPRLVRRLSTYYSILQLHIPIALHEVRNRLNIPLILVRSTSIHRHPKTMYTILRASVVFTTITEQRVDKDLVRSHLRKIVSRALSESAKGQIHFRLFRIGFARISLFKANYRRRRLENYGLGPDLICTIELKRIRSIVLPDISGATIEIEGRYRIAWNKQWSEQSP